MAETDKLFTCACDGDVKPHTNKRISDQVWEICVGCTQRWTPEARDGLAELREDIEEHRNCRIMWQRMAVKAQDEFTQLREERDMLEESGRTLARVVTGLTTENVQLAESQRLADEWLTKQLEVDEYRRHAHPTDKRTVLGDLLVVAHQAKLAYEVHRKTKQEGGQESNDPATDNNAS